MDRVGAAYHYRSIGLNVIPCKSKIPMVKGWRDTVIPLNMFTYPEIAISCGGSSKIEVIDIDNKSDRTDYFMRRLSEFPCVVTRTRSGGYHLCYRTDNPEGNMKLARDANGITLIETRGEGGIIIVPPTEGYMFIRGSLDEIPYLPPAVRCELMSLAKSFNVYAPRHSEPLNADEGNKEQDYDLAYRMLLAAGWVEVGSGRLRRPGKSYGSSATWGYTPAPFVFYVFSSNATPFESNRAYCPNQIVRLLSSSRG